jgi:hypothetical protein
MKIDEEKIIELVISDLSYMACSLISSEGEAEFLPISVVVDSNYQSSYMGVESGEEEIFPSEYLKILEAELISFIKEGKFIAAGICLNTRDRSSGRDALLINIQAENGLNKSVVVFYQFDDAEILLSQPEESDLQLIGKLFC